MVFLFTDVEGSTRLWEERADAMREALARHDRLLRREIESRGGRVFKTVGDAFYAVFPSARAAAEAALASQRALSLERGALPEPLKVRMALHAGEVEERDDDFFGPPLNRVARLLSAGHGGQVLLSRAVRELLGDGPPAGSVVRDLGERRFKDLARAERVFQLQASGLLADFPPLRTLDARPNNLPAQPNALIGREGELEELRLLLRDPGARLLTLTGPGGTGKTRLALQAAAEALEEFEHGAWLVPLAAVRDPAHVAAAAAAVLGVRECAGERIESCLGSFLKGRRLLLVLDNFEQVVSAAPLLADLLAAAPGLRLLVTSRSLLRVYGERDVPVRPLRLPQSRTLAPEELGRHAAVRLFVERARAARAGFSLTPGNAAAVAEICASLDGLPLAIELAAARVRLLAPEALRERLLGAGGRLALGALGAAGHGVPERQRTLAVTIGWSYELLDDSGQRLLRSLASFRGAFTLDAAAAVAELPDRETLLGRLESLLDQSFVRPEDCASCQRFSLLETIREFALSRAEERGEAAELARRHALYFLAAARDGGEALERSGEGAWLERLSAERDDLRAALAWALESRPADALRWNCGLWRFWEFSGHWTEGRRWLERALGAAGDGARADRARALHGLAKLSFYQGDLDCSVGYGEECLALARELGDAALAASALDDLFWAGLYRGDFAGAEAAIFECLELQRARGDRGGVADALASAAWVAVDRSGIEKARALSEECLSLSRELGDDLRVGRAYNFQGELARVAGDFVLAARLYRESLDLARKAGSRYREVIASGNLAFALLRLGKRAEAAALHLESLEFNVDSGNKRNLPADLMGLAAVAAAGADGLRAARLLGAAQAFLETRRVVQAFAERAEFARCVADARAALAPEAFAAEWAAGARLGLDEAVALAREAASAALAPG